MSRSGGTWNIVVRIGSAAVGLLVGLAFAAPVVKAQVHTTGISMTKTCPPTANQGDTITCTITLENLEGEVCGVRAEDPPPSVRAAAASTNESKAVL